MAIKKASKNNKKLTSKDKLFCQYYIQSYNATQAYIKAFNAKYNTANAEGYKMLVIPCIKKEIARLKKESKNKIFADTTDIINMMLKIAFSDIKNYAKWYSREEDVYDQFGNALLDKDGNRRKTIKNYIEVKDSDCVDSSLIEEISSGKNGFKIKLVDKTYALNYLAKLFDTFPDEWKRKIEEAKLDILKNNNGMLEDKEPMTFVDDIPDMDPDNEN